MFILAACLPLALIAYIVGIFLAGLFVVHRSTPARWAASGLFLIAWLAHLGAVVHQGLITHGFPLSNVAEYLLFLGWAVMSLHLLVWFGWRVDAAALLLPPLAALGAFTAWPLLAHGAHHTLSRPGGLFLFHTTVSTLGMATLTVALAMSLIYLAQDRALKSHQKLRLLERLPSLDRCDSIGFQSLWIGFLLLSLGIGTGVVVNTAVHGTLLVPGLKQTFPFLAWIVFAAILAARALLGFRGRKSAYLTITGVTLGLLTVIGMTL